MWLRAIIPIEIFNSEQQMYVFLDDFIKCCDDYKYCETFHFFIENCQKIDDCLELRMECHDSWNNNYPISESVYPADVNTWLNQIFRKHQVKINVLQGELIKIDTEYKDEVDSFGEDGWEIAKRLFEYTCRAAVHIKTGRGEKLFRETKFIHCFLNQCGYDSLKESAFHSNAAWQMLTKHLREEKKELTIVERWEPKQEGE
jgi:hypothetical protein